MIYRILIDGERVHEFETEGLSFSQKRDVLKDFCKARFISMEGAAIVWVQEQKKPQKRSPPT